MNSELTETEAPRQGLRGAVARLRFGSTHARLLGGSMIMLFGSVLVSVFNFGYNIVVARMLGAANFGHAAAAGTLLMLVSAITLSFQLVCTKMIARNETAAGKAAVYSALNRKAWTVGLVIGTSTILGSRWMTDYLNLPSPWLAILLAVGLTVYVPLGVKRAGLQGTCRFHLLSGNQVLETFIKLFGAYLLLELGFGVNGAVAALSLSVLLAYFFPRIPRELRVQHETGLRASLGEGVQAIVFFAGQVVINNVDILLVKHFFDNQQAGLYAAIAVVGRVLYLATWSVTSVMIPVSAGADPETENTSVLIVPLVIVLGLSLSFIVGLAIFPEFVLRATFGAGFQITSGMHSLLSLRAAATGTYAVAVVLMAYEMSRRIANTGWLQLAISGTIIAGIYVFHGELREIVVVQLVLMVLLLMIVALPFFKTRASRVRILEEAA